MRSAVGRLRIFSERLLDLGQGFAWERGCVDDQPQRVALNVTSNISNRSFLRTAAAGRGRHTRACMFILLSVKATPLRTLKGKEPGRFNSRLSQELLRRWNPVPSTRPRLDRILNTAPNRAESFHTSSIGASELPVSRLSRNNIK